MWALLAPLVAWAVPADPVDSCCRTSWGGSAARQRAYGRRKRKRWAPVGRTWWTSSRRSCCSPCAERACPRRRRWAWRTRGRCTSAWRAPARGRDDERLGSWNYHHCCCCCCWALSLTGTLATASSSWTAAVAVGFVDFELPAGSWRHPWQRRAETMLSAVWKSRRMNCCQPALNHHRRHRCGQPQRRKCWEISPIWAWHWEWASQAVG